MDKWIIWCSLNAEQEKLEKLFGNDAVSITGSMTPEKKVELEEEWRVGKTPILITKPKIFSYGLNWQHCNKMIFVGLSDSFEQVYQAIRRCYRFGQTKPVTVYMVTSELEGNVVKNIERKERDFERMQTEMAKLTKNILNPETQSAANEKMAYAGTQTIQLPSFLKETVKHG